MERFSDAGSTPAASTKWTLREHLLFQRRLCRDGVAVRSTKSVIVRNYSGYYAFSAVLIATFVVLILT